MVAAHETTDGLASSLHADTGDIVSDEKPLYGKGKSSCDTEKKASGSAEHERQQRIVTVYSVTDFPRWLKINLLLGNITVGVMFVAAMINLAFSEVMRTDLKNDEYDSTCDANYIRDASELADAQTWTATTHGQYHSQCQRLYLTSYVLLIAGSFSMLRAIPICFFPVQTPSRLSIRYRPDGFFDRLTTPARIYALRTIFSIVPAALYLFGVIAISTSPFMTGPRAEDSYKTMYTVSLAILGFSAVVSMHQAVTTAYAGLVWKLWRQSTS